MPLSRDDIRLILIGQKIVSHPRKVDAAKAYFNLSPWHRFALHKGDFNEVKLVEKNVEKLIDEIIPIRVGDL